MKKSDIVIAVLLTRSEKGSEKQIRKDLSQGLINMSLELEQWDQDVDIPIANAIIKNISTTRGNLSMEYIIRDIDIILNRIS